MSLASAAMSGTPVVAPALSLQLDIGVTSGITWIVISDAVTPTSVSFSGSDLHLLDAPLAAVVVVCDALLLFLSLRPHVTAIMPSASKMTNQRNLLNCPPCSVLRLRGTV